MLVSAAIQAISYALQGVDDDSPAEGSDDWNYWLSTMNRKQAEWARDAKQDWVSLFDIRSAGTVSFGTSTYDLDDAITVPADRIYITTSTGNELDFNYVKPQERTNTERSVYISGSDPQKLTFTTEFSSDSDAIGGTINVAGFYLPDDLVVGTDTIVVDDPNWLVMATAAELAFNNIIYEDRAEGLSVKSNSLYSQMVSNNRRGSFRNPRRLQTRSSYRIHSPNRRSIRGY